MPRPSHLAALVLILLTTASASAQSPCKPWFKHQQIGTFYNAGFAMVDLDPDGWLHLVGNTGWDGLKVWKFGPNGSVEFIETMDQNTDYELLAGDFDNDGDTDLITGHAETQTLHIFENTNGTLLKSAGTHIPDLRVLHAAADFDQDSLPDLVVTTPTHIMLYRNNNDGTFSERSRLPFDDSVYEVIPASLNSDGLRDMLVHSRDTVTPIRQNADGTFETLPSISVPGLRYERTLSGDVNNNGLTDLILPDRRVLLADGQEGFTEAPELDPRIDRISKLVDIDRDGDLDLLVNAYTPDGNSRTTYTLLNDGTGAFTFLEHDTVGPGYPEQKYILIHDVNRNGNLDIVAQRGRLIDLRFGSGDGIFDDVPFQQFFAGTLRRATLGDIDADGDIDIVATGNDPGPVIKVITNDGSGNFTLVAAMAAPSTVYERVALADFDADGDLDILAWTASHGLWIYENTPDGFFSQIHAIPHRDGGPAAVPFAVEISINGRIDIVVGDTEDGVRGYTVYYNNGDWDFARRFTAAPSADHVLAVADFNNDGRADLLCADSDSQEDELQICYKRVWKFDDPVPVRVFGDSLPFAMPGDFNGDGWMDFASYGWLTRNVIIMTNQRDGTFLPTATLDDYLYARDPGVLDLDGDGFDELTFASQNYPTRATLFSFNALGEVTNQTLFGNVTNKVLGSPVGDLNGDGATDILQVTGDFSSGGISVFFNQCPGAPCFPDLDNDGDTDTDDLIAFLNRWSSQFNDDCSGYDCTADLDKNGTVDTRDFVAYLNAWNAGC
ncbi:MAG: VCBS repeat-containing protein [Planctomycetota bacterium]|nr:VCBS repeat-containing protein [Planctomycetota bacterium]